jgi:hypothetical protein
VDVVWHPQFDTGVPSGTIEDQDDLLRRAGAGLTGKLRQLDLEDGNADRRREMEEGASGGGMDEADQIAPGEAMLDDGGWALTYRRPDPPQEGL